jgi:hypothetical protein
LWKLKVGEEMALPEAQFVRDPPSHDGKWVVSVKVSIRRLK